LFVYLFQTVASVLDGNPLGCFNWFGYLGDLLGQEFATKDAVQMRAMYNMLAHAARLE
jgi:hypothetical protein